MGKRLTWQEIVKRYPSQTVGLADIEWANKAGRVIKSATVKYSESDGNSPREIAHYALESHMSGKNDVYDTSTVSEIETIGVVL